MTKADAATILRGMCPQGVRLSDATAKGRQEFRDAIDVILRLADTKERS